MRFIRNPRVAALAVGAMLGLGLVAAAPLASAASLTSTQIGAILNLLQAFGADSATIANVQAVLENTSTSTSVATNGSGSSSFSLPPTASNCAVIATDLHEGSSGGEVTRLQQFLAKDKSVYPSGLVTGYFGSETEQAVQRWQAMNNIVASGTPSSTGFGFVGPRTRSDLNHELEKECEGGDHGNIGNASSTSSDSSGSEGVMVPANASSTASSTSSDNSGDH
ncbi:MAG TPA: peptidoglycan-binding domain-containing protein [Candidatus Paceibacterota bacterium]|nr:peptidoglycan-binding domain-containing protein [Candidatus Paceibacterota bacterium]